MFYHSLARIVEFVSEYIFLISRKQTSKKKQKYKKNKKQKKLKKKREYLGKID